MSVLNRISYNQGRRDEVPNQELARDLALARDQGGLQEIASHLWDSNQSIRSDCLKVLYETGYLAPDLIADLAPDFLRLLGDRNNRMVWGAMIALSTIASLRADDLFSQRAAIQAAMAGGSVITVDNGIKVLATLASCDGAYRDSLWPFLLHQLETCRPKEVPQHGEAVALAVVPSTADGFAAVLRGRMPELTAAQAARVEKIIRDTSRRMELSRL